MSGEPFFLVGCGLWSLVVGAIIDVELRLTKLQRACRDIKTAVDRPPRLLGG